MNTYYHRYIRSTKFNSSQICLWLPTARKSLKKALAQLMITIVTGFVRVINKEVVATTKRQNTFVKNVRFPFIQIVSLHTILGRDSRV